MIYFRSTLFHISFWLWTLIFGIFAFPALLSRKMAHRACFLWVDGALLLLRVFCGLSVDVRGRDNLQSGCAIYASKHQSTLDTLILWKMLGGPAFILKKQLLLLPIYGWFVGRAGTIAIDRKAGLSALKMIAKQAKKKEKEGQPIVIFPEGTRTKPGEKRAYKTAGIIAMYNALDCPVVPVALNTGLFWPKRQYVKRSGRAVVEFLPTIESGLDSAVMVEKLRDSIEEKSDTLI